MKKYILAFDQGTTSSRAILVNREGSIVGSAQSEFTQFYPKPGWVEHDAMEIWGTQSGVARQLLEKTATKPEEIAAVGIANQRETVVIWDRYTGKPIHRAIVWQCRRTADFCEQLIEKGWSEKIRAKTGLVIDAYFAGTKIKWILDHVANARHKAEKGELLCGTIDTWLIWNLTGGKVHVTDYSNASRTMLFNIHTLAWDAEILTELEIPFNLLPEVKSSSCVYGLSESDTFGSTQIPITAAVGDQQAALFGQTCFEAGSAKNTYGTGCFMLMNTGSVPIDSQHGLLTTIAWGLEKDITYALEGSIFIAGAAIQWLRDELRLISDAQESEFYASQVKSTNGVYVVPAFTGLGTPYWDMYARGAVLGLTRGAKREHLVRATLESIAYQTKDVLEVMQMEGNIELKELKVDGGASANNFLMQFQADMLGVSVQRPQLLETTALGAAFLAGLAINFWQDLREVRHNWHLDQSFRPNMTDEQRNKLYSGWKKAVKRSMEWSTEDIDPRYS